MNSKLEYRVSVSCDSNVAGQNGWGHAGRLSRPPSHPSDTYVLFMLCGESHCLTCLCFCVSSSQGVFHCLTETANLGPKAFYKVSPSRCDVLCIIFFFFYIRCSVFNTVVCVSRVSFRRRSVSSLTPSSPSCSSNSSGSISAQWSSAERGRRKVMSRQLQWVFHVGRLRSSTLIIRRP